MAFKPFKILKGLLIKEENTNTPKQIEITPGGTSNTKTTILSSQTTDKTLTLPDATDTLMGKATTDVMTNKTFDADGTGNSISNIENVDIKAAAGIVYSKLNLTNGIVDADINTTAAVTLTKLAAVTANKALQSDASGFIQASTVQSTELAHLSGVTSPIQTQLNAKANQTLNNLTTVAFNATLNPDSHNVRSIGASTLKINTIWVGSAVKSDSYDIVDGTSNNATIKGSLTYITSAPDTIALNSALMNAAGGRVGVMSQDDAVNGSGPTGDVFIGSGNKTAGSGNSGSIKLRTGTSAGGTRGKILLEDGSLGLASTGYVWTLDNTSTGEGSWKASSGGGASSLITNGTADNASASIFVPYQDSSGSRPSDGNGGTTTGITTSVSSTTPLVGTKSFLLTKDAANRQGGGWAVPFTVDPAYRAKSLKISMDYIVNTGTFVAGSQSTDSDVIVYIYDVTNSQLIEPSNIKFLSNSSSLSDKVEATFQTSSTGSSYRLIFHIATTSASAYELKADNVVVAPQTYVFGSPVTDWTTYTPTLTNFGNGTATAFYRRVGSDIEIRAELTVGSTVPIGYYTFSLPPGFSIDTTKITTEKLSLGRAQYYNTASGANYVGTVGFASSTSLDFNGENSQFKWDATVPQSVSATISKIFAVASIPAVGLSSSVQMSDQADTRVVSFSGVGTGSTQSLTANVTNIAVTASKDSHGAWSTNIYTVPVPGDYSVGAFLYSTTSSFNPAIYVNGTFNRWLAYSIANLGGNGQVIVPNLKVGDTISIRSNISLTLSGDTGQNISISRISGPSAIAATESVNCRYTTAAGQIINATTPIISFGTRVFDSHGFYDGTTYRPSISGKFRVTARVLAAAAAYATNQDVELLIYKNGSFYSELSRKFGNGSTVELSVGGSDLVQLNAGDTLTINVYSVISNTLVASALQNYLAIERIGN